MNDFITQKPHDKFLSKLVEYYFFIDIPIDSFATSQESIIPFPRITFGYFFEHPFLVTNHNLKQHEKVEMVISRISTQKITVLPLSDRIKIIGAHVKPYTLAYLTKEPVVNLPWLINTIKLFGKKAWSFKEKILTCSHPDEMFKATEQIFLKTLIKRNLQDITEAVDLIEKHAGNIKLTTISEQLGLTDRALRNQFNKYIGCSPKEFIRLVQLRQSVFQMKFSNDSLTNITYENNYFDQAHFVNSFKNITGKSPKELRKEMSNFRFLQF